VANRARKARSLLLVTSVKAGKRFRAHNQKPAIETLFWLEVILFEKEVLQIMR
jgi:hypothetical protein